MQPTEENLKQVGERIMFGRKVEEVALKQKHVAVVSEGNNGWWEYINELLQYALPYRSMAL